MSDDPTRASITEKSKNSCRKRDGQRERWTSDRYTYVSYSSVIQWLFIDERDEYNSSYTRWPVVQSPLDRLTLWPRVFFTLSARFTSFISKQINLTNSRFPPRENKLLPSLFVLTTLLDCIPSNADTGCMRSILSYNQLNEKIKNHTEPKKYIVPSKVKVLLGSNTRFGKNKYIIYKRRKNPIPNFTRCDGVTFHPKDMFSSVRELCVSASRPLASIPTCRKLKTLFWLFYAPGDAISFYSAVLWYAEKLADVSNPSVP